MIFVAKHIENITGYIICALFFLTPLIYIDTLYDYSDLPKKSFVEFLSFFMLSAFCLKNALQRQSRLFVNT